MGEQSLPEPPLALWLRIAVFIWRMAGGGSELYSRAAVPGRQAVEKELEPMSACGQVLWFRLCTAWHQRWAVGPNLTVWHRGGFGRVPRGPGHRGSLANQIKGIQGEASRVG